MQDDTQRADENAEAANSAADKVEELPQQSISDSDAEAVKGGSIVYQSPQAKVSSIVYQAPAEGQFKL